MNTAPRFTRLTAALATTVLAAGGLTLAAAPAQAAPAFNSLKLWHSANVNWSGSCTSKNEVSDLPAILTPTENTSVSSHASVSKRVVSIADSADYVDTAAKVTGTAKTTTGQGRPLSVELAIRTTATADAATPPSGCAVEPWASLKFTFDFVLTQPMWVTLNYAKSGASHVEMELWDTSNSREAYLQSTTWKATGGTTVLLPAGGYGGYIDGEAFLDSANTSRSETGVSNAKVTFAPVGSATAKPAGKAQGYAALAGARSCAVHALPAKLSSSSKRIKAMKKVSFAVNGKTVKTLRGTAIKRGLSLRLPIADASAAAMKSTVRLKNGKTYTAKASYRPCA